MIMKLYPTDEWSEDLGDCIFFHFPSFEEPPEVINSHPNCSDFDENGVEYWTHFIMVDFNRIIEQAIVLSTELIG